MAQASETSRDASLSIREKLRAFLELHPGGASTGELMGLLFAGSGSDPEVAARVMRGLLSSDRDFRFDPQTALWSLKKDDPLRIPLGEARYVVVDLETTGRAAGPGQIIEIGAYRMEGARMGEAFQTLVRPRAPILPFVVRLTSITNDMVRDAPPVERVLPAFREFLGDAVLVAHNAAFDHGFLDFEYRRIFGLPLRNPLLCTLRLARRLVPSLKRRRLEALAEHFGLSTTDRHRGLGDARMAGELLAIFIDIARHMGIARLDRLIDFQHRASAGGRIERHVPSEEIAALPKQPGVYLMRNGRGDLLYVGKARNLRDRVASYFGAGPNVNPKTAELINHVHQVETRITRSSLEAALLEARLIRELKPPFNRLLKHAAPAYFLKLDQSDPFPRIVIAARLGLRHGVVYLGPFVGRQSLERGVRALSRLLGLRTCAGRLAPDPALSPCIYGQMGRCSMPCNGSIGAGPYGECVRRAIAFLRGRTGPIMGELVRVREQASAAMRFEEAARCQRDLKSLATLSARVERLSQVVTENNLVVLTGRDSERAAHVVLSGRLALSRELDSPDARAEIARYIAGNFELYRRRAVERDELETMTIVARWLRERGPNEGRLIYLCGPHLDPSLII